MGSLLERLREATGVQSKKNPAPKKEKVNTPGSGYLAKKKKQAQINEIMRGL